MAKVPVFQETLAGLGHPILLTGPYSSFLNVYELQFSLVTHWECIFLCCYINFSKWGQVSSHIPNLGNYLRNVRTI